ncbi:GNAT family N-acetyltransferase [Halomonas sp. 1390]|uniref:GNAT family N-acetyltransferase n=1 Tax=Halomonas sp. B23F22_3 TaxID=3459516 RepID=UPI00373DF6F3
MNVQTYLIDTNIIIGLEDNHAVEPVFSTFFSMAVKHGVGVFVHAAARDDILRDKDEKRRKVSLSKLEKFQVIDRVRGLTEEELGSSFGPLRKPNDLVDSTLLHALSIGAADFLVTQDKGLHLRARRYSSELGRRVLHIADAVELLKTTFEPKEIPVRFVEEVTANTIPLCDDIFDTLREDYPEFDRWWRNKCIREHRPCWVVYDSGLAGLIVRKDEDPSKTDATLKAKKILKICTFKVKSEKRGTKLGELLLKKVFWYAQKNSYDLVYLTAYNTQEALIDLLEFYGFVQTEIKGDGEIIYEKRFSKRKLLRSKNEDVYFLDRKSYPRFVTSPDIKFFGIPIKEEYHDTLFPDLKEVYQGDLFECAGLGSGPRRPGNTIRKVYLCRSPSNLGRAGSLLFFYKGKSKGNPSQALTAIGVLEEVALASSTKDLMRLTGGRSVYSEEELEGWGASERPVKVINFLLVGYIEPAITLSELYSSHVFNNNPPQSIFEVREEKARIILDKLDLGFRL